MANPTSVEVQYEINGLSSLRETRDGTAQPRPHSHNEVELLLLEQGSGLWLMGGEVVTLEPGRLIAFWAIRPHQLLKSGRNTVINWLTIPLAVFIEWQLAEEFTRRILAGQLIAEDDRESFGFDKKAFAHWHGDLISPDRARQRLAMLEIEARLGRLAFEVEEHPPSGQPRAVSPGLLNQAYCAKISQIADYVSRNFSQPLSVGDIAKAIGMHPTSATKLFKKICGMNLVHYLTQHRIYHAQRLLSSTDMKILDVALESGYQSASRFYAAFKEFCGVSPQAYRKNAAVKKAPLHKPGLLRVEKARAPGEMLHKLAGALRRGAASRPLSQKTG